jgi:hypothetical protein
MTCFQIQKTPQVYRLLAMLRQQSAGRLLVWYDGRVKMLYFTSPIQSVVDKALTLVKSTGLEPNMCDIPEAMAEAYGI